jgi:hypothetical protein
LHQTLDRIDEQAADLNAVPQELHQLSKNRNVDCLINVVNVQKVLQEQIMCQKINQQDGPKSID